MNPLLESITYGFILAKITALILSEYPLGKSLGPKLFSVIYLAFIFLGTNIYLIELFNI